MARLFNSFEQVKVGAVIGSREVLEPPFKSGRVWLVRCRCKCGSESLVHAIRLEKGGCTCCTTCNRKTTGGSRPSKRKSHGSTPRPLFHRWANMLRRCNNREDRGYKDYGGRGICVCDEWRRFEAFREWALANGYDQSLQIDRIDNDGNYEPGNCRFVMATANSRNRRSSAAVKAFGETKTMAEWIEDGRCVVGYACLAKRLEKGWIPERAIGERLLRRH